MGERLVELAARIDFVYSPLQDVKSIEDVDVVFVEGAVASEEDESRLQQIRSKADVLVAMGTCACYGGIAGLRGLWSLGEVLEASFGQDESAAVEESDELPRLFESVRPLAQVVDVDHILPGCPPPTASIEAFVTGLLDGDVPEQPTHNLCEECERVRPNLLKPAGGFILDKVQAVFELERVDPERCFLEQGVLCMGPATREGCGARCLAGNMPCRGCMGPTKNVREQGCKMIDSLASILPAGAMMYLEDVVGTGYRFSLPISIYRRPTKTGGPR